MQEIIKKIYKYLKDSKLNISFEYVPAHKSEPNDKFSLNYYKWYGNHQADKLAVKGC